MYTWSRGLIISKAVCSVKFFFWIRDFLLIITSLSHSFIFLILILLNMIMHTFKFILIIFVWYPYWITKLFHYIFSKNILEFKLPLKDANERWSTKYIFLGQKLGVDISGENLQAIKKLWYGLFINKTNRYACLKSYFVIYCLIDRFLFLSISSFIWIVVAELCSLPICLVLLSFKEVQSPTIINIVRHYN
jgi:hypothetical protein